MDHWDWEESEPWLEYRVTLPVGALLARHRRRDRRPTVVAVDRPHAPPRGDGWCPATHRAAPSAPRARRRDGAGVSRSTAF